MVKCTILRSYLTNLKQRGSELKRFFIKIKYNNNNNNNNKPADRNVVQKEA